MRKRPLLNEDVCEFCILTTNPLGREGCHLKSLSGAGDHLRLTLRERPGAAPRCAAALNRGPHHNVFYA